MQRPSTPHGEKHHHSHNSRDQPQQHINQIDPHRILHPLDPTVTLRLLMNIQFPKRAKYSRPQDTTTRAHISTAHQIHR